MRRIMRLEAQVGGNHGGVLGEAIRACHLRIDNQNTILEEFHARIRARDWYHDLSEQESDEEIRQMLARAEGQEANVENQPGVENRPFSRRRARNHAPQRGTQRVNPRPPQVLPSLDATAETPVTDISIQEGMRRLYAFQQQCVDRVTQVDNRLEQFRHAIHQDALELSLTVQRARQDLNGQGQGMEQIRHTLFNIVQESVETLDERLRKYDEFLQTVLNKTDKNTHEAFSTIYKIIDEQADVRRLVEELARRMDNTRSEVVKRYCTGRVRTSNAEVNDLKTKVIQLTEQITEHSATVNFFSVMSEKVDLMERQIHRWRYRLPDLTDDESQEPFVSAVEVQEELNQFKDLTVTKSAKSGMTSILLTER